MLDKAVQCDKCNQIVAMKEVKLKEKKIDHSRTKRYWNCRHCSHEYLVRVDNKDTRQIVKLLQLDEVKVNKLRDRAIKADKNNRLTQSLIDDTTNKVSHLSNRMKANKDRLDKLSRRLIDEYKKEM